MSKVDTNDQNYSNCRCPHCPVEKDSPCAVAKLASKNEAEVKTAVLYCATGKSDCSDLDTNERCQCPTCSVWAEYDLNATYYCVNGAAK